jgi:Na+/H+ antiporter NhaD/arsenite permease-like protein
MGSCLMLFKMTGLTFIDLPILHPFSLPVYIPHLVAESLFYILSVLRILSWQREGGAAKRSKFTRYTVPVNYVTAPLATVLFLLAATVIGKHELMLGIIGDDDTGICPYDLVIVFLSLGYIANSLGAAGLVRWVVFKAVRLGKVGHRLYFYLYICFFSIGAFLGNDPIMVLFLSYFIRVASNIKHPRAWIQTQFCIANIATGILVSSNPTNLVLANAFKIRFVSFTANMVVPVFATTVLLFPFLLYIVFADESLIPMSVKVLDLPDEIKNKKPTNPNIRVVRERPTDNENVWSEEEDAERERAEREHAEREHILNPFLDKKSSILGSIIFAVTIILLLALNAVYLSQGGNTDFWVTLPAAVTMLFWDLTVGWMQRAGTRRIAQQGRDRAKSLNLDGGVSAIEDVDLAHDDHSASNIHLCSCQKNHSQGTWLSWSVDARRVAQASNRTSTEEPPSGNTTNKSLGTTQQQQQQIPMTGVQRALTNLGIAETSHPTSELRHRDDHVTLFKLLENRYVWCQETFPTTTVCLRQLPYDLVPFAFCMFILVEALISKGWVRVFAHWWDLWATKSGSVGCIAGMGFLGVVLSNVSITSS